jgi:hypothetical protein
MFIHIGRQALGETTNKSSDFIVLPRRCCVSSENFSIVSILSGTSLGERRRLKNFLNMTIQEFVDEQATIQRESEPL